LPQINLRGLDGIQGPVYVGTDSVFNRTALQLSKRRVVVVSSHHYVVAGRLKLQRLNGHVLLLNYVDWMFHRAAAGGR
jgi:hypothetical protein